MARAKADPSVLLKRLRAALEACTNKDVVDASGMAAIAGMTWRNLLVTHIEPDDRFPVQKRGAEGVAWEFRVHRVLKHMIKRASERMESNLARARDLRRLTGIQVGEDDAGDIGIDELHKLAKLTIEAQAAKERQRLYVPAERVRNFIVGYNAMVRDALLGVTSIMDPGGNLPAEQIALFDDAIRNIAVNLQKQADKFVKEFDAGIQQAGAG